MKKLMMASACVLGMAGCQYEATTASRNVSIAADQFEIERMVVFYNGITGEYMMTLQGFCAIADHGRQLEVTCKTGDRTYVKHFLGLSDNVTYFVEQLAEASVNPYHPRVVWRPQSIIPDFDLDTDADALRDAITPDGDG